MRACRPSFAMVCLESVRVTGCFPRDRDRQARLSTATQAGLRRPRPPSGALVPVEKHHRSSVHGPFTTAGSGRSWQACMEAGSHPVKIAYSPGSCGDSEVPSPRRSLCACNLWPESCTFFGQKSGGQEHGQGSRPGPWNRPGTCGRSLTGPDYNSIKRSRRYGGSH